MRIFVLSDIHVDFAENAKWLDQISESEYTKDALILAGDVAHNFVVLQKTLVRLKTKFKILFFVPGNHDLWVQDGDWPDSVAKFEAVQRWCSEMNIKMEAHKLGSPDAEPVWLVPLFSWYTNREEGADSLYLEKPGEDPENRMWSDRFYIKWPYANNHFKPGAYFSSLNKTVITQAYDAPVISFSHFLPRQDAMFGSSRKPDPQKARKYDRNPKFNFSRVAGSSLIEQQIRKLNSKIHVYGHQHINRDRYLDGVRYVSHCLGYPKERKRGTIIGIENGIKLIWNTEE